MRLISHFKLKKISLCQKLFYFNNLSSSCHLSKRSSRHSSKTLQSDQCVKYAEIWVFSDTYFPVDGKICARENPSVVQQIEVLENLGLKNGT